MGKSVRNTYVLAVLIFVLALGLRLAYLRYTPQVPVTGDAYNYVRSANRLINRGQFDAITGMFGPGYPVFLAGVFSTLGDSPWSVRYMQALLGALTCMLIFSIGTKLMNKRVGLAAALLAALYPIFILYTGRLYGETTATFLFWLGMLGWVHGLKTRAWRWLILGGVVIGCSMLSRVTLISSLPFLVLATLVSLQKVTALRRIAFTLMFAAGLAAPLGIWNAFYANLYPQELESQIIGRGGISLFVGMVKAATNPDYDGWAPDDRSIMNGGWWRTEIFEDPLAVIISPLNLIFYHIWFADNGFWQETFILSSAQMNLFHRVLVLFSLIGSGIALLRWRTFAPLLLLIVAFGLQSVKWIEIRHNILFVPVLFILSGLFLDEAVVHLFRTRAVRWLVAALLSTAIILFLTEVNFSPLIVQFPAVDFVTLGHLVDWGVVVLILGLGISGYYYLKNAAAKSRWIPVAAFVFPVIFVGMFGAYTSTELRWSEWAINLAEVQHPLQHEFRLSTPLVADQVESAALLFDLEAPPAEESVGLVINGTTTRGIWERLFCLPDHNDDALAYFCIVYETFTAARGLSLANYPQWWRIPIDPILIEEQPIIIVTLTAPFSNLVIRGANLRVSDGFYGPALGGRTPSTTTSLYRWGVLGDWRLRQTTPLDSVSTRSFIQVEGDLPAPLAIRLLVTLKDGRELIY